MNDKINKRKSRLRRELEYHPRRITKLDEPEISDYDYEMMFRRLTDLEADNPEYDDPSSPTKPWAKTLSKLKRLRNRAAANLTDVFSYTSARFC